jgi:hypothetical protein
MAVAYEMKGPVAIKVDTGATNALELLGYSEDGVMIDDQVFREDIKCDLRGGQAGPPDEVQYFGAIHLIQFTLVKFDAAVLAKVLAHVYGQTAGTVADPGTFLSDNGFRLLLHSTSVPRNYLLAAPWRGMKIPAGTRATRIPMTWEAHAVDVSGTMTLYNATTT